MSQPSTRGVLDPSQKRALAKDVHAACFIRGDFILRSGLRTDEYFDKYQLTADPSLLLRVTETMTHLVPAETELLAGLELGAIPIVTMISQHTGLPAVFVRKKAKAYGTAKLVEGPAVEGRNLLIVEDVVTSGGQIAASASDLRALGASVSKALCIIDREEGGAEALERIAIRLVPLFGRREF